MKPFAALIAISSTMCALGACTSARTTASETPNETAVDARPPDETDPRPRPAVDSGATGVRRDASPADVTVRSDAAADAGPPDDVAPMPAGPRAIPVLWIDVAGKSIPGEGKVPGRLKVFTDPQGSHEGLATRTPDLDVAVGIDLHGNSSTMFPKKPFNVELRDAAGNELEVPLLGMPKHADWVLHACYTDKTCVRNTLAYALGRALGGWSPRTRYTEVFLDGQYNGLYVLVEKVKRGKDRLGLPAPAPDATGDLTGGYIFKVDSPSEGSGTQWRSSGGLTWVYHYPKWDKIVPAQKAYLQDHLGKFEAVMRSPAWADSTTGYPAWINVASFVDHALVQELVNNVDGYWRSAFFFKQSAAAGNRTFAGPLWDFDLSFGNSNFRLGGRTDVFTYATQERTIMGDPSFGAFAPTITVIWTKLWSDPAFQRALKCRWTALRKTVFAETAIMTKIDDLVAEISVAEKRDHARWPIIGTRVWNDHYVGKTYAEDVAHLKKWLSARLTWLDARMPGTCP